MKIYLAGPDVFLPDAVEIGRRKAAICARHGMTGLYPLDNAVDLTAPDASLAIFKGNEAMMDAADAIMPTGLVLSAAVALILSFTGWLGGELVFRHRVGVADQPE